MDNNYFNNKLRELRKNNNLTQAQVAKALGLKLNTYSHLELDGKRPSVDLLQKICNMYLISIEELTGEKKKKGYDFRQPEMRPLIFSDNFGDLVNTNKIFEEPQFLRDLQTTEQDIILYYRQLPEEEQKKIVRYIERTFKKNIPEEK